MTAITTRDELIRALTDAAALEHSVICQYLFAAFSMKKHPDEGGVTWPQLEQVRSWQSDLLLVAREEMEHLGLVCNLLTAVGGTPSFRRPCFPHASPYAPPGSPFTLEPFGEAVMERFLYVERMHGVTVDGKGRDDGGPRDTIGSLYSRIRRGLEYLHADGGMLVIGPDDAQVDNGALDLPEGWFDFNLFPVKDVGSSVRAIDQIVEAGDGEPMHAAASHYARFDTVRREMLALRARDPDFQPARPVLSNPRVCEGQDHDGEQAGSITHPITCRTAHLYNAAYETMLLMLVRFYAASGEPERPTLLRIAFFPMMTLILRPLGEMLTLMPAAGSTDRTAGPTFELRGDLQLPHHSVSAWIYLDERLRELVSTCSGICADVARLDDAWALSIHPRLSFLHENLERILYNFEQLLELPAVRARHHLRTLL